MHFVYFLLETSFLLYPLVGILLCNFFTKKRVFNCCKIALPFFVIIDLFYLAGYSSKGDYVHYTVVSLHYLLFCLLIASVEFKKVLLARIFRLIKFITLVLSMVVGMIGILLFIVISQDFEYDKKFHFTYNHQNYEVRRYIEGFVTSEYNTYTFVTYSSYLLLPFEKKIDESIFIDTKTDLPVAGDLQFSIIDSVKSKYLIIQSTDGVRFAKQLK